MYQKKRNWYCRKMYLTIKRTKKNETRNKEVLGQTKKN